MSERIETVVLDSEGLSAWIAQGRKLLTMLQLFHGMGADLVIGANSIVEVTHSRTSVPRLNWTLSRIKVEPVPIGDSGQEHGVRDAAPGVSSTACPSFKRALGETGQI